MNGSLIRASKIGQSLILLNIVGVIFSSCGGSQTTLASLASTSSGTTTTPAVSSTAPTTGEEEASATIPSGYSASNLFVTVPDSIDFLTYTSLGPSHSSRCTFTSSSVVNDLTCVVETSELDSFFNGIKLQMNVPANRCKYIGTTPYWYYNYEIGTGPSAVSVNVTKNASGIVTASTCSVDGSAFQSCTAPTDARFNDVSFDVSDSVKVQCRYDTSNLDGGVNCCLGKYDLTTITTTPDGPSTDISRGIAWGGNVKDCIGGAGKTNWELYTKDGYPAQAIEKMKDNTARTKIIKVSGPIKSINGQRSNIPVANFFTTSVHTHSGFGTASGVSSVATEVTPARPSPFPYFVDPISDRTGSYVVPGNPYYQFRCFDEAFETNYRIRVMVQEWDTVAALNSYITSGVSSPVNANVAGTAPTDCPGQSGEACNQVQDTDDFLNANGGTWSNSAPTLRGNYFPKHSY